MSPAAFPTLLYHRRQGHARSEDELAVGIIGMALRAADNRTDGMRHIEPVRDQVPMKRGYTYEDVCNVPVFLASDQSGYMTGQAVNVTGGQEMR
jgi:NAD(P)-dependent dehydrogenase (short-subunit alcohol dehydrogenase family)